MKTLERQINQPIAWIRLNDGEMLLSNVPEKGFEPIYSPKYVAHLQSEIGHLIGVAIRRFEMSTVCAIIDEMRPKNDPSDWTQYAKDKNKFCDEAIKAFQFAPGGYAE